MQPLGRRWPCHRLPPGTLSRLAQSRGGYNDQSEKVSSGAFAPATPCGCSRPGGRAQSWIPAVQAVCPGSGSFSGVLIRRWRVIGAGLSSGAPLGPPRRSRATSSSLGRSVSSRCELPLGISSFPPQTALRFKPAGAVGFRPACGAAEAPDKRTAAALRTLPALRR
jgi:hypothetical protein